MHFFFTYFFIFLRGIAMGIADLIPGVSGGTIALITGIYSELLKTLNSFNKKAIIYFFKGQWFKLYNHVNANFLLCLVAGIFISVFSFASLIRFLITNHSIGLWSFFFGLIIASFVILVKSTPNKKILYHCLLLSGTFFAVVLSVLTPLKISNPSAIIFFISGALAICAMILPGISGSFLLVLIGIYDEVLLAVVNFDLLILLTFFSGCIVGLLAFTRVINKLISNYYTLTLGFLSGLMLGSLYKIWPWKIMHLNNLTEINISPWSYLQHEGLLKTTMVFSCILAGSLVIFSFDYISCVLLKKVKTI